MGVDTLNEDGFGLLGIREISDDDMQKLARLSIGRRTWIFELHSVVMLWILPPVTPGGFSASMDWRMVSSSVTQDMAAMSEVSIDTAYFGQLQLCL